MITAFHDHDPLLHLYPPGRPMPTLEPAEDEEDELIKATLDSLVRHKSPAHVRATLQKAEEERLVWQQRLTQEALHLQATGTPEDDPAFPFLINRLLHYHRHLKPHLYRLVQDVGWEPVVILAAVQCRHIHQLRQFIPLTPEITLGFANNFRRTLLSSPLSRARQYLDRYDKEIPFLQRHLHTLEDTPLPVHTAATRAVHT